MQTRTIKIFKTIVMLYLVLTWCSGCSFFKAFQKPAMSKLSIDQYPDFYDDMDYDGLIYSIQNSLSYLKRTSVRKKTFTFGKDIYDTEHMIRSLEIFLEFIKTSPMEDELNRFIRDRYLVYRSTGHEETGRVLFTGYYEPEMYGSRQKDSVFKYPLYTKPTDMVKINLSLFSKDLPHKTLTGQIKSGTVVPYPTRKQIEQDRNFSQKATPLAYVKDPIDLFFLQIQGSGKVYLTDGTFLNVHYHTENGQPYRSIGKLLIDEGKISRQDMSMQKIREYLTDHPQEVNDIFNYNPSYVFFKTEKKSPLGCLNVLLTPARSIATDRRVFPAAAMAYIQTQQPLIDGDKKIRAWSDLSCFALNQDTGGAIKGPGRVDIFWGNGPYAQIAAGYTKHYGQIYFLILKPEG